MTTFTTVKPDGTPTWVDLMAPDPEAARNFYKHIFGWEYDVGGPEFGGYTTARIGDRTSAGISGMPPGTPENTPSGWGLFFASSDLDADVARAVALGATVITPPMSVGPFGGMAVLTDPTGASFSFWKGGMHIGARIADEPGSMAWHELYTNDAKKARAFYAELLHASADPMPGGLEYLRAQTRRRHAGRHHAD